MAAMLAQTVMASTWASSSSSPSHLGVAMIAPSRLAVCGVKAVSPVLVTTRAPHKRKSFVVRAADLSKLVLQVGLISRLKCFVGVRFVCMVEPGGESVRFAGGFMLAVFRQCRRMSFFSLHASVCFEVCRGRC